MEVIRGQEICLTRSYLCKKNKFNFKIVTNDASRSLISGIILSPEGLPVKHACIEVYKEIRRGYLVFEGRTFSNECGKYGFTLIVNPCANYLFNVYAPLEEE